MWEPSLCLILSSYDTLLLNDVVETNNFAAEYHLSLTAFLWEPEKDISQAEVKVGNYLFDLQLLLEKTFLLLIIYTPPPPQGWDLPFFRGLWLHFRRRNWSL